MDAKLRDEEARRQGAVGNKGQRPELDRRGTRESRASHSGPLAHRAAWAKSERNLDDPPKNSTVADLSMMSGLVATRRNSLISCFSQSEAPKLIEIFPGSFKEASESFIRQDPEHSTLHKDNGRSNNKDPALKYVDGRSIFSLVMDQRITKFTIRVHYHPATWIRCSRTTIAKSKKPFGVQDSIKQRMGSATNIERLRDFIKHVYVDRRFSGGRSNDKPPRGKMGDKEDVYENRRTDGYQGGSRSPPYDDIYERRYSDRSSPGGTSDDRNRIYGYDESQSHARPEIVNDSRGESITGSTYVNKDRSFVGRIKGKEVC